MGARRWVVKNRKRGKASDGGRKEVRGEDRKNCRVAGNAGSEKGGVEWFAVAGQKVGRNGTN